jgi:hypothetical protein
MNKKSQNELTESEIMTYVRMADEDNNGNVSVIKSKLQSKYGIDLSPEKINQYLEKISAESFYNRQADRIMGKPTPTDSQLRQSREDLGKIAEETFANTDYNKLADNLKD